jgi:2-(1,2-epoxy-1,2-dihydrophenyl)acetyl-CoA isomerase
LSIESERISAQRCFELGIANKVVPAAELRDAAVDWAKQLCKRAPLSLAATKKVMRHAMDHDWQSCFTMEAVEQEKLRASDDAKEGVDAFFEKRAAKFTGK